MEIEKDEEEFIDDRDKRNEVEGKINQAALEDFYGGTDKVELEGRAAGYYSDAKPTIEEVHLKNVPQFVQNRIREAAQDGTIPNTLRRYTQQLKSVVTPDKHSELQRLSESAWSNRYNEEIVDRLRREFIDVIGGLKVRSKENK